jgi:hypothetical protein
MQMKLRQLTGYILIALSLFLTSCDSKEEIIEVPIIHHPLKEHVESFQALNNFTMSIEIKQHNRIINMVISTDDYKSAFQVDESIEYYLRNESSCSHYYMTSKGYAVDTKTCESISNDYRFLKHIEADWFSVADGRYYLNIEHYQKIQPFFRNMFPTAVVANFELIVLNDVISGFLFDVSVDSVIYQFDIALSQMNQTVVEVPVIE